MQNIIISYICTDIYHNYPYFTQLIEYIRFLYEEFCSTITNQNKIKMESAHEFLQQKGFKKVHQPFSRYNLTIGELVDFLNEYANRSVNDFLALSDKSEKKDPALCKVKNEGNTRISSKMNTY